MIGVATIVPGAIPLVDGLLVNLSILAYLGVQLLVIGAV